MKSVVRLIVLLLVAGGLVAVAPSIAQAAPDPGFHCGSEHTIPWSSDSFTYQYCIWPPSHFTYYKNKHVWAGVVVVKAVGGFTGEGQLNLIINNNNNPQQSTIISPPGTWTYYDPYSWRRLTPDQAKHVVSQPGPGLHTCSPKRLYAPRVQLMDTDTIHRKWGKWAGSTTFRCPK